MKMTRIALSSATLSLALTALCGGQNPPPDAPPQGAPPQGAPGPREGAPGPREGGPREGGPRGERGAGGQRGPNLEGAMKNMARVLKALKAQVGDASKKDENLKLVATFQAGCATSKSAALPPNLARGMDDAAKAKLDDTFRTNLRALMATAIQLEDAILAGKTDDAAKLVAKLEEMRESGHKALGVKED